MSGIRHYLSRSKVKDCLDGGEKHGVRYIDETNRHEVNEFIREQWFSTDMVIALAKERGCKKVILITTNDNINAIAFYQKRGFDMAHLYHNALEVSRRLKSEIPLIGEHGIKLMHEIEFEYIL